MTAALQALIVRWRAEADKLSSRDEGSDWRESVVRRECADELEAALNGSPSGVDAAFEQLEHEDKHAGR